MSATHMKWAFWEKTRGIQDIKIALEDRVDNLDLITLVGNVQTIFTIQANKVHRKEVKCFSCTLR